MKTIEFDLEKDKDVASLSDMFKTQKIDFGHELFIFKIRSLYDVNQILYASFLLLLVKYFIEEKNSGEIVQEPALAYAKNDDFYAFYLKTYDMKKLEKKIEEDFNIKIEIEKKNPLDEVFGIWKDKDITLEKIRDKAWQRTK